jgi:hypothetical protein
MKRFCLEVQAHYFYEAAERLAKVLGGLRAWTGNQVTSFN